MKENGKNTKVKVSLRTIFGLVLSLSLVLMLVAIYSSFQILDGDLKEKFKADSDRRSDQIAKMLIHSLSISDYFEVLSIVETLDEDKTISYVQVKNAYGEIIASNGDINKKEHDNHVVEKEIKDSFTGKEKLGEIKIVYNYSWFSSLARMQFITVTVIVAAIFVLFWGLLLLLYRNLASYMGDLRIQFANTLTGDVYPLKRLKWIKELSDISNYLIGTSEQINLMRRKERELLKNAAIGETTSMLAHDVRKPFSGIKVILNQLDTLKKDQGALDRAKNDIEKSLKNVESMINEIMDFSREMSLEARPESLVEILDFSILQASKASLKGEISFEYDIRNKFMVMADSERLVRALTNILVNAVEAIENSRRSGGKIGVSAWDIGEGGGERACIIISNNGPYIDRDDIPKLFASFFTKGKGKGTGLGLASTKRIIELHGGRISARNNKEANRVEFEIMMPASVAKEQGDPAKLPANIKQAGMYTDTFEEVDIQRRLREIGEKRKKINILLLEDEALYRAYLRNILEKKETLKKLVTVYETQTVEDAIQLTNQMDITHAIIDIDLKDDRTGLDFIRTIKKSHPNLKCMVHSNRTTKNDERAARLLGVDSFVPKPISLENLILFLAGENLGYEKSQTEIPLLNDKRIILFCDDEPIMRMNVETGLRDINPLVELHTFQNAEELISKLRELGDCYAVISDEIMGKGMRGTEMIRRIRQENYKCKAFIVSNSLSEDFKDEVRKSGANGLFESPLSNEDLRRILTN